MENKNSTEVKDYSCIIKVIIETNDTTIQKNALGNENEPPNSGKSVLTNKRNSKRGCHKIGRKRIPSRSML